MKKHIIVLLSVMIMLFVAGCSIENNEQSNIKNTEEKEVVQVSSSEVRQETEIVSEATEESTVEMKTEITTQESTVSVITEAPVNITTEKTVKNEETETTEKKKTEKEKKPEKTTEEKTEESVASYDPNQVVSLAIAKCQAGGMITTTDNLKNLLAEGKITKEEYDSYYPYDGLGYYSVFVETDLNKASTVSGRKLGSVEAIANHIAGMMLLETEPLFNISYVATYNQNGTEFYEFRCYR